MLGTQGVVGAGSRISRVEPRCFERGSDSATRIAVVSQQVLSESRDLRILAHRARPVRSARRAATALAVASQAKRVVAVVDSRRA